MMQYLSSAFRALPPSRSEALSDWHGLAAFGNFWQDLAAFGRVSPEPFLPQPLPFPSGFGSVAFDAC